MRSILLGLTALLVVVPAGAAGATSQPLASDNCGVNELADTDMTAPDPPWADLCAVTLDHATEDDELASVTVVTHVAGNLEDRTDTTSWATWFETGDCRHQVRISDSGVTGEANASFETMCGRGEPQECQGIYWLITEVLGGSCSAGPVTWEQSESTTIDLDEVEFTDDQIRVTLTAADFGPLATADLVPGRVVTQAMAYASTGLGSHEGRATFDGDWAFPTGETYALD